MGPIVIPAHAEHPGEVAATLIGSSAAIRELKQEAELASRFLERVMIVGEFGVGKRRLARLIHRQSVRCRAPYVAVRCADRASGHLERRLFGDSWTLAGSGALDRADGGTIFLEDVDALSPMLQSRLVEFLAPGDGHQRSPRAVPRRVNVRIICSTTHKMLEGGLAGSFRKDLYYLLNTIYLSIPPLRERPDDVEPLLDYLIAYYARRKGVIRPKLTHEYLSRCRSYEWPGNLQQLQTAATMFVDQPTQWLHLHRPGPFDHSCSENPTEALGYVAPWLTRWVSTRIFTRVTDDAHLRRN